MREREPGRWSSRSSASYWSDNNNTRSEETLFGPRGRESSGYWITFCGYAEPITCSTRVLPDFIVWGKSPMSSWCASVGERERERDSQKGGLKVINVLEKISPCRSGRGKVHLSYLQRGKVRSRALPHFVCHQRDSWTALCGGAVSRLWWKCAVRRNRVQVVVQSAQRCGLELVSVVNVEAL